MTLTAAVTLPIPIIDYITPPPNGDNGPAGSLKINQAITYVNALSGNYVEAYIYEGYDPTGATDQWTLFNGLMQLAITTQKELLTGAGQFLSSGPLVANVPSAPGAPINHNLVMTGSGNRYPSQLGAANWNSNTTFIFTDKTNPGLCVTSGSGCTFRNFALTGQNFFSNSANAFIDTLFPADLPGNYLTNGIRNGVGFTGGGATGTARYSPCAGIVVDGTNCPVPSDGGYSKLTYTGSDASGSDDLLFENIGINGFAVGIVQGLSGFGALSDFTVYRSVGIYRCDIAYASSHNQSFGVSFESSGAYFCRELFNGTTYGNQQGVPPKVNTFFGIKFYRAFNLQSTWENLAVFNPHFEQFRTLGNFFTGATNSPLTAIFTGGSMVFYTETAGGNLLPPVVFETDATTTFIGTAFSMDGGATFPDTWNFVARAAPIKFIGCNFPQSPIDGVPPFIGLDNAHSGAILDGCTANSASSRIRVSDTGGWDALNSGNGYNVGGRLVVTYNSTRFRHHNVDYEYLPLNISHSYSLSVSSLTLTGAPGAYTGVTFTVGVSPLMVQVGDVLMWKFVPQGGSTVGADVIGIKVTSVDGVTGAVVCALMYDQATYDTVVNQPSTGSLLMPQIQWAPCQALTCTTDGSTNVITAVSPTTALKNRFWVTGTGLPSDTRVVSGQGTATVTLNQATTAANAGTALRFGSLNIPTTSVAF